MAIVVPVDPLVHSFQFWREQHNKFLQNIGYAGKDDAQDFFTQVGPAPNKIVMTDATTGLIDGSLIGGDVGGIGATGGVRLDGSRDRVFYENEQVVTVDYTLSADKNAVSAGPVTVNPGITVTVPPGQAWTIV